MKSGRGKEGLSRENKEEKISPDSFPYPVYVVLKKKLLIDPLALTDSL
jgi:hypothetical protein